MPYTCIHCGKEVEMITIHGFGTTWTHTDGFRVCVSTFASPRL